MSETPGPERESHPLDSAQASRIYLLPNLMTAGNLFCGFLAIIRCIQARFAFMEGELETPQTLYNEAVWFIIGAVVFDSLDGRLARLGGRESLFGKEFDSIADVVSFGVAPALLVVFLILSPDLNEHFRLGGFFIGFIYLLCAGVRLARFNVITHPLVYTNQAKYNTKDFVGLPVPAAAGMIGSLVLTINAVEDLKTWVYGLPPLMLLIAFLMVSTIRYPSFKQVGWQTRTRFGTFVLALIIAAFIFFFRQYALVLLFLAYLSFGIARHILLLQRRRRRLKELIRERRERAEGNAAASDVNKS
ncbi:MAG TPA: CDP-diacylglycerol--serine O-phosphatidyltransferase [Opitutaceae bacterium]